MRPNIDIGRVVSGQELDQIQVSLLSGPMKGGVTGSEVFGLGQSWIIPEHLDQGDVVPFGGGHHPLLDGLIKGADGG